MEESGKRFWPEVSGDDITCAALREVAPDFVPKSSRRVFFKTRAIDLF
jgi:hypothetical protein